MQKFLPSALYSCLRGVQNTWEVSFQGQHIAKRSFLKYGGEDMAAKHVLWEAWAHHTRRTGESCQVLWLQTLFGTSTEAQTLRQRQGAALDATALAQTVGDASRKKAPRQRRPAKQAAEPGASAAEPAGEAAEPAAEGIARRKRKGLPSSASTVKKPPAKRGKGAAARKAKPGRKRKFAEPSSPSSDSDSSSSSSSSSSSGSSNSAKPSKAGSPQNGAETEQE